ncbi:MAG: carboxypeptidase-like regulatory domain-containing protein [Acidobacteriota bacterium]|nr:carboxypeptidase-like regulatory domain-containing protein [Acidobacteriota bacterium]
MRRLLPVCALLLMLSSVLFAQLFGGQKPVEASDPRTLTGTVYDKSDHPVPNAMVSLKNMRTLAISTYITAQNGEYRFNSLSPTVDYQVWAEQGGRKSAARTLSSFDSRKQAKLNLKFEK